MKVHSIRTFFGKPGSSKASSSQEENVVEIPARGKKASKKSKKDDRLDVSVTEEESDQEDPIPSKIRKKVEEQKNGKDSKKKRKPVIIEDDDSDAEDPLPKSLREKEKEDKSKDKKRKARVLSESEEDDDFKPKNKKSPKVKPAPPKLAKVEKQAETKKKEEPKKTVNPADFFSSAPVKRETKERKSDSTSTSVTSTSPEKKKDKSPRRESPRKKKPEEMTTDKPTASSVKTPPKSKSHNEESSPHRPPTSLIEPKKLKLETPTPEKRSKDKEDKSKSSKLNVSSPPSSKTKEKEPEKKDKTFKVPTPVNMDKSKPRTPRSKAASTSKRSTPIDEEDDEDDFDPKQKAVKSEKNSTPSGKASSSKKKDKKTPSKDNDSANESDGSKNEAKKLNYQKYLAKQSMQPRNLGSKMIPIGAPDCLLGLAFVISGVLDSLERDDCKDLIEKYGGRVTGSVSGKTNYLIIGEEAGESKTKKANQLKVPLITEDDLLELIRKSNPNGESQDSGLAFSEIDSEQIKMESDSDYDPDKSLFSSPVPTKRASSSSPTKKLGPSKLAEESPRKKLKVEETVSRDVKPSTSTSVPKVITGETEPMWVDKYRPKVLKNVVGQGNDKSNAKKLLKWLQDWFDNHGAAVAKPKASKPGFKERDPDGITFKAALLSGPPGVGKTTTAHLAVREVGYDYYELNASDTRNKKGLHQNVSDALSNKTLVFGRPDEEMTRKHVLIMDEVDGMSGNEDRGGVQELISLIKSSKVPVICICNDRNHQKIRSLSNYCYDLRFNKPSFEQLRAFILSICFKEKIKLPMEKVHQLIISTDNDVRQILHQLELFKEGKSDQAYNPRKDLRFGPWDVIRKVFLKAEHDKMSIHDKAGLFFQDYNIGPLFVQENYPKWVPAKANGNRNKHMALLAQTASSIGNADLTESLIRRSQNWSMLPVQAIFSSFIPGELMEANSMGNVEFPQWLGKNSNKNKRQRLLQTLHTHLHLQVSGSLEALNMDYLPYLRRTITNPLAQGDIDSAAAVMNDYSLLRDDVESITDLAIWPGMKDPMEKVDSKTKAAFTRKVNKEILPYSSAKPVKAKGRGGGGGNPEDELEDLMGEESEAVQVEEDEEEESIEKDAMVKVKTKKAGTSKAKASSSSSGRGGKKKAGDDDDEEDYGKGAKGSKSKQPAKSRKK